jgi:hypothetical protein
MLERPNYRCFPRYGRWGALFGLRNAINPEANLVSEEFLTARFDELDGDLMNAWYLAQQIRCIMMLGGMPAKGEFWKKQNVCWWEAKKKPKNGIEQGSEENLGRIEERTIYLSATTAFVFDFRGAWNG